MSQCASCGKSGDDLKTCNACKQAKYCNAACQRSHWRNHKKDCKKRAAELFDEALFKEPPPREDCPICFVRLPCSSQCTYQTCCGKEICNGCTQHFVDTVIEEFKNGASYTDAMRITDCPFCRTPCPDTDKENIVWIKKRMENNEGHAYHMLAFNHLNGTMGLPQDTKKSFELWVRATELGHIDAANSLGISYLHGRGVNIDAAKGKHYLQIAAMGGHPNARATLGSLEEEAGNMDRAMKHYRIAVRSGLKPAFEKIQAAYLRGIISVDEVTKSLYEYVEYQKEVETEQRKRATEAMKSSED